MWARDAVKKGADVPDKYKMKELLQDKEAMAKHAEQVSRLIHLPLCSRARRLAVLMLSLEQGVGSAGYEGRCGKEQGKREVDTT